MSYTDTPEDKNQPLSTDEGSSSDAAPPEFTAESEKSNQEPESTADESKDAPFIEAKTKVLEIDYDEAPDSSAPDCPDVGEARKGHIKTLHVLGDIHGWAPGLVNYLIHNKLASIEIDGHPLGSKGKLHETNIRRLFGRTDDMSARDLPPSGLAGRPGFLECVNGSGHGSIRARWIADNNVGFIQIGDVFDRSDHSEVAAEILRQLTIDAPNRVFTLVGNHEQFMLEHDFESWQMNEVRNAVTDHRDRAPDWSGRHLRFLSTEDENTQQRAEMVFQAYRESTQLLFLTQAAVQQRTLQIDHGLTDDEIDELLSTGWLPYQCAPRISSRFDQEGLNFPGALVALVFGDTLFHHAEPNHKRTRLPEQMNWADEFGWMTYTNGGGNIQGSPNSGLLWSRGASAGSSAGSPSSESMLEQISVEWPGLYQIVHGHTPTGGVDDFRAFTASESTTISYLGEAQSTPSYNGKASKIRIYNIDEGMAPVYYGGSEGVDNPLRIPVGLRVAAHSERLKPVLAHSESDEFLILDRGRDVRNDTRKLWKWKTGQNRTGLSGGWNPTSDNRWSTAFSSDGIEWLLESTEEGKELLSRRISEYDIPRNVLLHILNDARYKPEGARMSPLRGALYHLNYKGGKRHLTALQQQGNAWRIAKGLQLTAVGHCAGKKRNTIRLFVVNGLEKKLKVRITALDEKPIKSNIGPQSVNCLEVELSDKPIAIHMTDIDDVGNRMKEWLGLSEVATIERPVLPFIAHYPAGDSKKKVKVNQSRKGWEFPVPSPKSDTKETSRGRQKADSRKASPDVRRQSRESPSASSSSGAAKAQGRDIRERESAPMQVGGSAPQRVRKDVREEKGDKKKPEPKEPEKVPEEESFPAQSTDSSVGSNDESAESESAADDSSISPYKRIKWNKRGGFELTLSTNELRSMIVDAGGKPLPGASELIMTISRYSDDSPIVNIGTNNAGKKWDWSLMMIPFLENADIGGKPRCKRGTHGIITAEATSIFSSNLFKKLMTKGMKGPEV